MRPEQTFADFVSGPTFSDAFEAATALARAQPGAPRFLLLCGPPAVGKTHLLRAIVECTRKRRPAASIAEVTAAVLVERMLAGLAEGSSRFELQPAELLVVDDLHILSGKARTQIEMGHLFRTVLDRGGRVACASGGSVSRIQVLPEAVRRLTTAKVVELTPPTPQEIRRILLRHATASGLRLRAPTTAILADQARGDVRRAIGALTRMRFERTLSTQ